MNTIEQTAVAERTKPVTVAVVDDNSLIRMGLRSLLDADERTHVVGEAADGDAAVALIRAALPDVVLLDVRMPRRDGVSVLAEIRPYTKVLMLTYSEAPDVIRAALEAGADGYLVHGQFRPEELVGSVLSVAQGSSVMSAPALTALRAALTAPVLPPEPVRPEVGLSVRETEIMDLIARGMTNGEIARSCYLSEKTVKNHVNHIFAKLDVRTRAEAVSMWLGGGA